MTPTATLDVLDALTALAKAEDPRLAVIALHQASEVLGEDARVFAPLLETLLDRTFELDKLRQLAGRDELTGISNRRAFNDALKREAARTESCGFAVILLDLDDLKVLNDAFGHAAGDEAIQAVADACSQSLRASDLVARLGGDEFAILLSEATPDTADAVAKRVRCAIESRSVGGQRLAVSMGIACATHGGPTPTALLGAADDELYADKCRRKGISRPTPIPSMLASNDNFTLYEMQLATGT